MTTVGEQLARNRCPVCGGFLRAGGAGEPGEAAEGHGAAGKVHLSRTRQKKWAKIGPLSAFSSCPRISQSGQGARAALWVTLWPDSVKFLKTSNFISESPGCWLAPNQTSTSPTNSPSRGRDAVVSACSARCFSTSCPRRLRCPTTRREKAAAPPRCLAKGAGDSCPKAGGHIRPTRLQLRRLTPTPTQNARPSQAARPRRRHRPPDAAPRRIRPPRRVARRRWRLRVERRRGLRSGVRSRR